MFGEIRLIVLIKSQPGTQKQNKYLKMVEEKIASLKKSQFLKRFDLAHLSGGILKRVP